MATHIEAINVGVGTGAAGQYTYNNTNPAPALIKNTGDVTVYIGAIDVTGSAVVSPNSGYPLLPGESIEVPAQTDPNYRVAFNTAVGNGNLRILGVAV